MVSNLQAAVAAASKSSVRSRGGRYRYVSLLYDHICCTTKVSVVASRRVVVRRTNARRRAQVCLDVWSEWGLSLPPTSFCFSPLDLSLRFLHPRRRIPGNGSSGPETPNSSWPVLVPLTLLPDQRVPRGDLTIQPSQCHPKACGPSNPSCSQSESFGTSGISRNSTHWTTTSTREVCASAG